MSAASPPTDLGSSWGARLRWLAALAALPGVVYLFGFVLALPMGLATSLPFWAKAKDYTCSATRTESLMVRVNPYVSPKQASKTVDWDCRRIALLGGGDIGAGVADEAPESGAYYVRIFTPTPRPPARAEGSGSLSSEILILPSRAEPQREAQARPPQRSSQQASP